MLCCNTNGDNKLIISYDGNRLPAPVVVVIPETIPFISDGLVELTFGSARPKNYTVVHVGFHEIPLIEGCLSNCRAISTNISCM